MPCGYIGPYEAGEPFPPVGVDPQIDPTQHFFNWTPRGKQIAPTGNERPARRSRQHSSAAVTQRYIGIEPQWIEKAIEGHAELI